MESTRGAPVNVSPFASSSIISSSSNRSSWSQGKGDETLAYDRMKGRSERSHLNSSSSTRACDMEPTDGSYKRYRVSCSTSSSTPENVLVPLHSDTAPFYNYDLQFNTPEKNVKEEETLVAFCVDVALPLLSSSPYATSTEEKAALSCLGKILKEGLFLLFPPMSGTEVSIAARGRIATTGTPSAYHRSDSSLQQNVFSTTPTTATRAGKKVSEEMTRVTSPCIRIAHLPARMNDNKEEGSVSSSTFLRILDIWCEQWFHKHDSGMGRKSYDVATATKKLKEQLSHLLPADMQASVAQLMLAAMHVHGFLCERQTWYPSELAAEESSNLVETLSDVFSQSDVMEPSQKNMLIVKRSDEMLRRYFTQLPSRATEEEDAAVASTSPFDVACVVTDEMPQRSAPSVELWTHYRDWLVAHALFLLESGANQKLEEEVENMIRDTVTVNAWRQDHSSVSCSSECANAMEPMRAVLMSFSQNRTDSQDSHSATPYAFLLSRQLMRLQQNHNQLNQSTTGELPAMFTGPERYLFSFFEDWTAMLMGSESEHAPLNVSKGRFFSQKPSLRGFISAWRTNVFCTRFIGNSSRHYRGLPVASTTTNGTTHSDGKSCTVPAAAAAAPPREAFRHNNLQQAFPWTCHVLVNIVHESFCEKGANSSSSPHRVVEFTGLPTALLPRAPRCGRWYAAMMSVADFLEQFHVVILVAQMRARVVGTQDATSCSPVLFHHTYDRMKGNLVYQARMLCAVAGVFAVHVRDDGEEDALAAALSALDVDTAVQPRASGIGATSSIPSASVAARVNAFVPWSTALMVEALLCGHESATRKELIPDIVICNCDGPLVCFRSVDAVSRLNRIRMEADHSLRTTSVVVAQCFFRSRWSTRWNLAPLRRRILRRAITVVQQFARTCAAQLRASATAREKARAIVELRREMELRHRTREDITRRMELYCVDTHDADAFSRSAVDVSPTFSLTPPPPLIAAHAHSQRFSVEPDAFPDLTAAAEREKEEWAQGRHSHNGLDDRIMPTMDETPKRTLLLFAKTLRQGDEEESPRNDASVLLSPLSPESHDRSPSCEVRTVSDRVCLFEGVEVKKHDDEHLSHHMYAPLYNIMMQRLFLEETSARGELSSHELRERLSLLVLDEQFKRARVMKLESRALERHVERHMTQIRRTIMRGGTSSSSSFSSSAAAKPPPRGTAVRPDAKDPNAPVLASSRTTFGTRTERSVSSERRGGRSGSTSGQLNAIPQRKTREASGNSRKVSSSKSPSRSRSRSRSGSAARKGVEAPLSFTRQVLHLVMKEVHERDRIEEMEHTIFTSAKTWFQLDCTDYQEKSGRRRLFLCGLLERKEIITRWCEVLLPQVEQYEALHTQYLAETLLCESQEEHVHMQRWRRRGGGGGGSKSPHRDIKEEERVGEDYRRNRSIRDTSSSDRLLPEASASSHPRQRTSIHNTILRSENPATLQQGKGRVDAASTSINLFDAQLHRAFLRDPALAESSGRHPRRTPNASSLRSSGTGVEKGVESAISRRSGGGGGKRVSWADDPTTSTTSSLLKSSHNVGSSTFTSTSPAAIQPGAPFNRYVTAIISPQTGGGEDGSHESSSGTGSLHSIDPNQAAVPKRNRNLL